MEPKRNMILCDNSSRGPRLTAMQGILDLWDDCHRTPNILWISDDPKWNYVTQGLFNLPGSYP